jgi:glycyl-tRNA synthetase alpha subunit
MILVTGHYHQFQIIVLRKNGNIQRIFFTSLAKRNAKILEMDEVESYLRLCKTLEDLKNFPTIMKMYK